jgi:hypothetical protein
MHEVAADESRPAGDEQLTHEAIPEWKR